MKRDLPVICPILRYILVVWSKFGKNTLKAHQIDCIFLGCPVLKIGTIHFYCQKSPGNTKNLKKNGNTIFLVQNTYEICLIFQFHPKFVWHGHASMPRKMLTGLYIS